MEKLQLNWGGILQPLQSLEGQISFWHCQSPYDKSQANPSIDKGSG